MTDKELLENLKLLVFQEKKHTAKIIYHLKLVEERKLYCDMKYKSLFEYCTLELDYTEDQSWRRISAVRLSQRFPKITEELEKGKLSLTTINLLSGYIKEKKLSKADQKKLIDKTIGLSKSECMSYLNELRRRSGDMVEEIYKINLNSSAYEKLQTARGIFAHQIHDYSGLIELMVELSIDKKPKTSKAERKSLTATMKIEMLQNAKFKCQNCNSSYALQIDHIIPKALGGGDERENLRVLCRNCNLRAGIKDFGTKKMKRYISLT
jgi:5-methylcytosine-specific restriction endonuclease McrA